MPPCERSGTSSPDKSCRSRLVPITVSSFDTTTRSPMRSAGSSNRCGGFGAGQYELRCRAAPRFVPPPRAGRRFAQVDQREGSQRAVMHDVGIGDRQDHPRLGLSDPRIDGVLQVDHVGLAGRVVLGVHAVVGGDDHRGAELIEPRESSSPSSRRNHSPTAYPARPCAGCNRSWKGT
jgi:hypothetical protein